MCENIPRVCAYLPSCSTECLSAATNSDGPIPHPWQSGCETQGGEYTHSTVCVYSMKDGVTIYSGTSDKGHSE